MNRTSKPHCIAAVALAADECERRLARHGFGRVGVTIAGRPVIFPVNYRVLRGAIVFAADGHWVEAALAADAVAFEIDDHDDVGHVGWSVLVVGKVRAIDPDDEACRSVAPWCGTTAATRWLELDLHEMSGRHIELVDRA